jgi:hypothetical protein
MIVISLLLFIFGVKMGTFIGIFVWSAMGMFLCWTDNLYVCMYAAFITYWVMLLQRFDLRLCMLLKFPTQIFVWRWAGLMNGKL